MILRIDENKNFSIAKEDELYANEDTLVEARVLIHPTVLNGDISDNLIKLYYGMCNTDMIFTDDRNGDFYIAEGIMNLEIINVLEKNEMFVEIGHRNKNNEFVPYMKTNSVNLLIRTKRRKPLTMLTSGEGKKLNMRVDELEAYLKSSVSELSGKCSRMSYENNILSKKFNRCLKILTELIDDLTESGVLDKDK